MNFTKTPPTTPGDYIWREEGRDSDRLVRIWQGGTRLLAEVAGEYGCLVVADMCGEWCRLVPESHLQDLVDACQPIAKDRFPSGDDISKFHIALANAERVMEGRE